MKFRLNRFWLNTMAVSAFVAIAGSASAGGPTYKIIVNEFLRAGNLTTTDEWAELVLLEDMSAAELNTYFLGDSTSSTAAKFAGYQFTGMEGINNTYCKGTIITVAGDTGPASDTSYNPAVNDWNITLKTSGANLTSNGSNGDFAGTDVVYVDTDGTNGNNVLTANGFAINWDSTPGTFGSNATFTLTNSPANNTGAQLSDIVDNAHLDGSWVSDVLPGSLTPGLTNGFGNTTSIFALRDSLANVASGDVSLDEGNAGTTAFIFTVTRTNGCLGATVFYDVTPTGANAADAADFGGSLPTGSVSFNTGETSKDITVLVSGDTSVENDETFLLSIYDAPIPASIEGGTNLLTSVTGTILNDDVNNADITIDDVTQTEGNAGTTTFDFTVSITPGFAGDISVDFTTADNTATTANSDYVATSGTVDFSSDNPGVVTQTVSVTVNGDTTVESDETFFVNLSNVQGAAVISDSQGLGTIQNDDVANISINDVTQTEGNAGTSTFDFTVSIDQSVNASVEVNTANGTATAGSDYTAIAGQVVNFTSGGATTQTVSVTVNGDVTIEPNETFFVNLSNASGALIADNQGLGTIQNDDNIQAILSGSKSVSGDLVPGGTATYTIVLNNTGPNPQNDNPGDEMTDILPTGVTFVSANATSGTVSNIGNTVSWNGSIPAASSVTVTINVSIDSSARGQIDNQATINFDNDGDNSNESSALSNIAGFFIPFVIPSLSTYGITLLMLMVIGLMFFRQNKTMN
ncbi:MAG TPA: Calx-beta domain-containing protein [Gammaproteobacteria bacterium]|nr:DUF11 domain-containing protein [Xanthomonadales bacterium]MCB1594810.1 DUF11 domain-containing protein [Xanthomonadales bacterium]HOP23192.1 Calx-beta domain-containing protein [Gammaproteobacteria bacterium]HPI95846.1 Calx-beta domain-containing protein [Gammaproteobacteria bacterium]HPQ87442.1 Calx-beta domain-containing protein [Gammaproteobacteria bacterium]